MRSTAKRKTTVLIKCKTPPASNMNMIIHQATNKSYLIVAVDALTAKHMIFEIAMKNITRRSKVFVCLQLLCFRNATL
jgi:hypothetical protein